MATSRATAESAVTPSSVLRRFTTQAAELHGAPDGDYTALWQWSVDHVRRYYRPTADTRSALLGRLG
jgi:hypothetical protein